MAFPGEGLPDLGPQHIFPLCRLPNVATPDEHTRKNGLHCKSTFIDHLVFRFLCKVWAFCTDPGAFYLGFHLIAHAYTRTEILLAHAHCSISDLESTLSVLLPCQFSFTGCYGLALGPCIKTIRHVVKSSAMRLCTLQHMTHHTWPVSSILRVWSPFVLFS